MLVAPFFDHLNANFRVPYATTLLGRTCAIEDDWNDLPASTTADWWWRFSFGSELPSFQHRGIYWTSAAGAISHNPSFPTRVVYNSAKLAYPVLRSLRWFGVWCRKLNFWDFNRMESVEQWMISESTAERATSLYCAYCSGLWYVWDSFDFLSGWVASKRERMENFICFTNHCSAGRNSVSNKWNSWV